VLTSGSSFLNSLLFYLHPAAPTMATSQQQTTLEKPVDHNRNNSRIDMENIMSHNTNNSIHPPAINPPLSYNTTTRPFIGRVGGNQGFVLDRHNAANAEILREQPDSAPCMTLKEQFDLRGFRNLGLWKAALIEGLGACPLSPHPSTSR
jgi:hypothetical protein